MDPLTLNRNHASRCIAFVRKTGKTETTVFLATKRKLSLSPLLCYLLTIFWKLDTSNRLFFVSIKQIKLHNGRQAYIIW